MIEKAEEELDLELTCQSLYCIYKFLINKAGIEYILKQENIILFFFRLLELKNPQIKKLNDEILDIIRDQNPNLSEMIKEKKFYLYNKEWIESVEEYDKTLMNANYNY
jgi:Kinesin-associated protein (KAP)